MNDGDFRPEHAATTDPAPGIDHLGDQPDPAHHRFADRLNAVFDPDRIRWFAAVLG
ncbi:hypothetical protein D9M71_766670 [compost metagenome]